MKKKDKMEKEQNFEKQCWKILKTGKRNKIMKKKIKENEKKD